MENEIKVLLVDDQIDFLQPMAFWLKSRGCAVQFTTNAEEAMQIIKSDPPQIVFLDIVMPEMDGPTLFKKIREFNQTIPIVMMSSYIEDKRAEKTLNFFGPYGVFFKGDDFSKALAIIESLSKK